MPKKKEETVLQEEPLVEEAAEAPAVEEEPVAEEPKPGPKPKAPKPKAPPEVKGRPVTKKEAKAATRQVDAKFLSEFDTMRARVAALEAKAEIKKPAPTTGPIRPLQPDEFPAAWAHHGWEVIVPRKTGETIIIGGFKVPLVAGEICKVPKNVLPLAIAGGYI